MMKRYLLLLSGLAFPAVALAHNVDAAGPMPSLTDQLSEQMGELLPFMHASEGHPVAAVVSALLWASLIYTVYTLGKRKKWFKK